MYANIVTLFQAISGFKNPSGLDRIDIIFKLANLDELEDVSNRNLFIWVWFIFFKVFQELAFGMLVQLYVFWFRRTFSPVCLPFILSRMWVQWILLWEFSKGWGQPISTFLHHCGCIISCPNNLPNYLSSGRFTRVPPVFTDHIFQHLMSHQGWSMFLFCRLVCWYCY